MIEPILHALGARIIMTPRVLKKEWMLVVRIERSDLIKLREGSNEEALTLVYVMNKRLVKELSLTAKICDVFWLDY